MSSFGEGLKSELRYTKPVILLGMHRSGTSLVTRLLMDMGIHMGYGLSRNAESPLFQRLNDRILSSAGARWNEVKPVLQAMRSQEFVDRQADATRRSLLRESKLVSFFGSSLWEKMSQNEPVVWGWKDPLTTITFPVWIRLFPNARFVHVLRNGIDVAISLHRRSQKPKWKWWRYFSARSNPSLAFRSCFRLWEDYVTFALVHKRMIRDDKYSEMRYEDLLTEPQDQLRRIADFLAYPIEDTALQGACKQINPQRLDNSQYAAAYRDQIPTLAATPLMRDLAYSYIAGESKLVRSSSTDA